MIDSFFFVYEFKRILKNVELEEKLNEITGLYQKILGKIESFRYRVMCENFYYLQFNINEMNPKRNNSYTPEGWMQICNFEILSCLATAVDAIDEDTSLHSSTFFENFMIKPKYLKFAAEFIIKKKRKNLFDLLLILTASSLRTAVIWFDYLELKPSVGYEYRQYNPNTFKDFFLKFLLKLNGLGIEDLEYCKWELFVYLLSSLRFFESENYNINTQAFENFRVMIIKFIKNKLENQKFDNYPLEKLAYLVINLDDICPYYIDEKYFEIVKTCFLKQYNECNKQELINRKEIFVPQILRALLRVLLKNEKIAILKEISIPHSNLFKTPYDIIKKIMPNTHYTTFEIKDEALNKKANDLFRSWNDNIIRTYIRDIIIQGSHLEEVDKSEFIEISKSTHDSLEIADLILRLPDYENYYIYLPVKSYKEGGKSRSISVPVIGDQYLRPFRKGINACVIIISVKPLSSALLNSIHDYRQVFKIPIFFLADESLFRFIFYHKPQLLDNL